MPTKKMNRYHKNKLAQLISDAKRLYLGSFAIDVLFPFPQGECSNLFNGIGDSEDNKSVAGN
jgi:hypothetical protein